MRSCHCPRTFAALRELATPFAAAWVVVPNTKGSSSRVCASGPTTVPVTPIATVPKRAVKHENGRDRRGARSFK